IRKIILTREIKPKPKRPAHSGKTAQEIFDEIKNANGQVTNKEILNYMQKNGSTLKFKDELEDSMDPFISLNLQTLKNKEDKKVLLSKAEFNEDIALFAYTLHEAIIVDIKRQEDELKRKYTSEISEKM
ncbi:5664_t:CDS:2, partial [Gigaspora rosea]